jgi:hypothetical protein
MLWGNLPYPSIEPIRYIGPSTKVLVLAWYLFMVTVSSTRKFEIGEKKIIIHLDIIGSIPTTSYQHGADHPRRPPDTPDADWHAPA